MMTSKNSSSVVSTLTRQDGVQLDGDTTEASRSKTQSPVHPTVGVDTAPVLDLDERASTQTEGIFRRFIVEMGSRRDARDRCSRDLPASSALQFPSPDPATATAATAADDDEDDDDQLS